MSDWEKHWAKAWQETEEIPEMQTLAEISTPENVEMMRAVSRMMFLRGWTAGKEDLLKNLESAPETCE